MVNRASKKRYILRTSAGQYVGRGYGNEANPSAYGLCDRPSPEDWRSSRAICEAKAMNWAAQASRLGVECPVFEIVEKKI